MSAAPVPSRPRRPWAEPARPRLRNLLLAVPLFLSTGAASAEGLSGAEATAFLAQSVCPVSYTHLTLPTKRIV